MEVYAWAVTVNYCSTMYKRRIVLIAAGEYKIVKLESQGAFAAISAGLIIGIRTEMKWICKPFINFSGRSAATISRVMATLTGDTVRGNAVPLSDGRANGDPNLRIAR
jgi:hypothetical protein